ncbi:MAG TPA: cation:proton antiporter [Terrimicrobiaceae bacterium]
MNFDLFYILIGVLLVSVAMLASSVKRLPLSETMIYLAAGTAFGPLGLGFLFIDAEAASGLLERLAEIAVIISLFTTGLKLRVPLHDPQWWIPIGLASSSMVLTVGMVTIVGMFGLGLPLGGAVLLGAVLAPTDPVLASGVQLENVRDRDRLRFSLTGEAGLNDGTAFPFVMLGLGLCGLHELGAGGWKWWAVDVVWAIGAGLAIGALCGALIGQGVIYLRREHHEGIGRDELLALGLIALSYGAAVQVHAYGFLAVFAAGLALRAVERGHTGREPPPEELETEAILKPDEIATHPEKAPAHMAGAVLAVNEQMERIVEVALVLVIAAALSPQYLGIDETWFIAVLFLVIRPIAVHVGLLRRKITTSERRLISWFGIRGIGSLYYLMFVVNQGLPKELTSQLISLTLTTIAVSIIAHGITVTPMMNWYQNRRRRLR